MAGTARPIARGTLDMVALNARRERAQQRKASARQQTPTHPIYDPGFPDDSVETQIAFKGAPRLPWFFADGIWQQLGVSWCYLSRGTPVTIPSDSAFHPIDVEDGVTGSFFTDDDNTFTNGVRTISLVDYHGIKIHKGGMYAILTDGVWSGLSAAAVASAYWTRLDGGANNSALSAFQWGRVSALGNDAWDQNKAGPHTSVLEFLSIPGGDLALDGSGPYDATPVTITLEAKQTGTGSPTVLEQMWIVKLRSRFLSNSGTFG